MSKSESLDIVIPVRPHPAYYAFLPICIDSILANVQDDFRFIYLIGGPEIKDLPGFPFHPKVQWISESDLLTRIGLESSVDFSALLYLRPQWMRQQLFKIYSFLITDADQYLVVDADLCFLKPVKFYEGGKFNFYLENEYHAPYFKTIQALTGLEKTVGSSFIADHLIFRRQIVQEMLTVIEQRTGQSFPLALNDVLAIGAQDHSTNFSEYELYGTYLCHRYPNLIGEFHQNPVLGLPHFYLPQTGEWNYSKIQRSLNHPYPFMPMIAEHKEQQEPAPLTVKKLFHWR